ncbi:FCS-Like Zinc finger 13-like [Salvia divinorum]|uniref:FCS-Like Zinc finger 13-like n=1 Tax=Salvia divinorum TaxID=28513 RepID=A0ABD1FK45_SALDI
MLGETSKPVIKILTGSLCSGSGSTRSQIQSPRGLKSLDLDAVGLGIVAALEKSDGGRDGILGRNLTRSSPISVNYPKNCWSRGEAEEYTYTTVTCHGPSKSYTKVYSAETGRSGDERSPFRIESGKKSNRSSVFHISPARGVEAGGFPTAEFLSRCDLCQKKLHGKDIYIGEKAFCSSDCRYTQMVMDERKDKCSAKASKPTEVAVSSYANGKMFTTGILAT